MCARSDGYASRAHICFEFSFLTVQTKVGFFVFSTVVQWCSELNLTKSDSTSL